MTLIAILAAIALPLILLIGVGLKTAATANNNWTYTDEQDVREFPVQASTTIYRDTFVGTDPAGHLGPHVPGFTVLRGVSTEQVDNSAGAAAAKYCDVRTRGDLQVTIASVGVGDIGKPVFATDDSTAALTGHPDAFVGKIINKLDTNTALVRLKQFDEKPPNGVGSIELVLTGFENFEATGATAGTLGAGGFELESILGLGISMNDAEDGGIKMEFDGTSEAALNSVRLRNDPLPVDKGLSFEVELCVTAHSGSGSDLDFGFGTALTTNSEADVDHADMAQLACFHQDGGSDNILAQSDDATTDVAVVDTTIDNDASTDVPKKYKITVSPTGVVRFWCDSGAGYVRLLSGTAFQLLSTAVVSAFVNAEKTSTATAVYIFRKLRVCGGVAA